MALPGLDTTNISLVAFWNALDNGASEIDPQETTGVFDTYESYSNGVQGIVTVQPKHDVGFEMYARVKDDGWIIAWLDRTPPNEYLDRTDPDQTGGRTRLLNDYSKKQVPSPDQNNLERIIFDLKGALSNSGTLTYNSGDVSLYDYEYPDAAGIHQMGKYAESTTIDHAVSAGSNTTVYAATLHAVATDNEREVVTWDYGGADIQLVDGDSSDHKMGHRDIAGRDEFTSGDSKTLHVEYDYYTNCAWSGVSVWG